MSTFINPNFTADIARARGNYTKWLQAVGNYASILRPSVDSEGISAGQPGAGEVAYSNVAYVAYPWGSSNPPVQNSALRRQDLYANGPTRISLPYGTDIKVGDMLAQEPLGTGLPIYLITSVMSTDRGSIDVEADGDEQSVMGG
ncbi:MAG TPA: hypothetical protein VIY48_12010 [Candidatus Paceibacterota bacterium]